MDYELLDLSEIDNFTVSWIQSILREMSPCSLTVFFSSFPQNQVSFKSLRFWNRHKRSKNVWVIWNRYFNFQLNNRHNHMECQVNSGLQDRFFERKIIKSLIMSFCFQQSEISPNRLKTTHNSHICITVFPKHGLSLYDVPSHDTPMSSSPSVADLAPVWQTWLTVYPPSLWFSLCPRLLPWSAVTTVLHWKKQRLQGICSDYTQSFVVNPSRNLLPLGYDFSEDIYHLPSVILISPIIESISIYQPIIHSSINEYMILKVVPWFPAQG